MKKSKHGIGNCKINLPVVEIGEEHDSAKEEGHEHEETVDHVEHAVLHEHCLNTSMGIMKKTAMKKTCFPAVRFFYLVANFDQAILK